MSILDDAIQMKSVSPLMAAANIEHRNNALRAIKESLLANKDEIFKANKEDLDRAAKDGVAEAVVKRLKFDEHKLSDVCNGIDELIKLPDPLGNITLNRELDSDLVLKRITCPIGVIGVIFEARPDALVQISSLCVKSGNCAILKGGKETASTNRVLFTVIKKAVEKAGLPGGCLFQAESHSEIDELLKCDGYVDLLIPRGSNAFVQYIMNNTKIPVMGHADGICHIYVDKEADLELAVSVIIDAKLQYTAVCNAVETLLINREIAPKFLPMLKKAFEEKGVTVHGTKEVTDMIGGDTVTEADFKEYLKPEVSVKLVSDVNEAVAHINKYGSHHTDAIITKDDDAAAVCAMMVDSAGVYRNCSTRFADGFRYGFGAEVGVSTGKLHARGPVGLEGLVTYKYLLTGNGNIVGDYASGTKSFHFKDLD
jgi:glutamate-5-semialdehyde dehydrogenase